MFRRAPFFLLWQDAGRADKIDLGETMKPTDEEQAQMKEALEIIKAEYRAETDPGRCDRLDLAIQYIENRIAGRLSTLDQMRALCALMDEEEDDQPVNALRIAFGPGEARIRGQHRRGRGRYPRPDHSGAGKGGARAGHDTARVGSLHPVVHSLRNRATVVLIWDSLNMLDLSKSERIEMKRLCVAELITN